MSEFLDDNMTFSSSDPGGHEIAQLSFPRKVRAARGMAVRITAGLDTVFLGRVQENQPVFTSSVAAEGMGARLKDGTFQEVFRDSDLSRWQGASVQRKIDMIAASVDDDDPQTTNDKTSGAPSLETSFNGPFARAHRCEAWYDSNGVPLGQLFYAGKRDTTVGSAAPWGADAFLLDDDIASVGASDTSGSLIGSTPFSGSLSATTGSRVFAMVRLFNTGSDTNDGRLYPLYWTALAVYGTHGLTLRGTDPAGGFWPSDIAWNIASRVSGIQKGIVEDASGFVVPQSVYLDPTGHEAGIDDMAKLVGWHYGVWEPLSILDDTPRFDFRSPPSDPTAWVTQADLEDVPDLSERLADLYDTVRVTWQDTAGSTHTETRTLDVPELDEADMSPRVLPLDLGVSTQVAAQTFGDYILRLQGVQARAAGQCTVVGDVQTASGPKPAHLLKAGLDRLQINDLPTSQPLLSPLSRHSFHCRRVETTVSREGVKTNVELDNGANLTEVLQARMSLVTDSTA